MIQTDDLIGKHFSDGGRGPDNYDCWGLASEVFRRFGKELPDYQISCEDASRIGAEIEASKPQWVRCDADNPPVPSLVVMYYGSTFCNHTGVYIGNGRFIHARENVGVSIDRIDGLAWKRKIEGYYVPGW